MSENLKYAKDTVIQLDQSFGELEILFGFAGSDSGEIRRDSKENFKLFRKAKSLDKELKSVEERLKGSDNKLQSVLTQLNSNIKIDEMGSKLIRRMDRISLSTEEYCAESNVPPPEHDLCIDFANQDERGNYCTPEGELRSAVLSSTTPSSVVTAHGAPDEEAYTSRVHGVSGMAGVGKTIALIEIGRDEAVRSLLNDGVLLIRLGAEVTEKLIIERLAEIMRVTGAKNSAAAVQEKIKLADAVSGAARWFRGRCNLFLVDDVWPTP